MKKLSIALAIVLLIGTVFAIDTFDLLGGKSIAAAESAAVSSVTVSGEGKISIKPDIAFVQLGVDTKNIDATVAQSQNKDTMLKVMEALKAQGIKDEEITTVQYNIFQTYDYTVPAVDGQNPPMIYQVTNSVKVTLRDINTVGKVIDAASAAGSNVINSIAFDSTQKEQVYLDALKLAMNSAKGKATAIMTTFDKKPGVPFKVFESGYNPGPVYSNVEMLKTADASTPIQSGELEIIANVSVEYQY